MRVLRKRKLEIGDCFELPINESLSAYFQYIADDKPMLNSDCIRFFMTVSNKSNISLQEAYESGTWFYSHTYISKSEKLGLIKFIESKPIPEKEVLDKVLFKSEADLDFPLRIRKIGQALKDSEVSPQKYMELKDNAWDDSTMGPLAFAERIELKLKNPDYEHLY